MIIFNQLKQLESKMSVDTSSDTVDALEGIVINIINLKKVFISEGGNPVVSFSEFLNTVYKMLNSIYIFLFTGSTNKNV